MSLSTHIYLIEVNNTALYNNKTQHSLITGNMGVFWFFFPLYAIEYHVYVNKMPRLTWIMNIVIYAKCFGWLEYRLAPITAKINSENLWYYTEITSKKILLMLSHCCEVLCCSWVRLLSNLPTTNEMRFLCDKIVSMFSRWRKCSSVCTV